MTAHKDKKPEPPQGVPPPAEKNTGTKPDEKRDPDLYNPVGMAGEKAGIVKEIQQDLKEEAGDAAQDAGEGASPKE